MRSYQIALRVAMTSLLGCGLFGCDSNNSTADMGKQPDLARPDLAPAMPKGVYTLSNDPNGNQIFAYTRAADGSLTLLNSYPTGGKGTGMGLGDQNALVFDSAQNLFFAVNAGDNTISMMSLKQDGTIALLYQALSGGFTPVSITSSGGLVYVVNAGTSTGLGANIVGFQMAPNGLVTINNSTKALSANTPGPAQIQFTPDGKALVVTEKSTNKIDVFPVTDGVAGQAKIQNSQGMTPFGFAFSSAGKLIVSEAAGGVANQGSTSSYSIAADGTLTAVSSKVVSNQTAPCWVTVANNFAYVTNAGTNNITSYRIGNDGALTLLNSGISATTGMGPTDVDVTDGNEYLYALNSKDHSFSIYSISTDGSLTKKPDFTGLPNTAVGLVAR